MRSRASDVNRSVFNSVMPSVKPNPIRSSYVLWCVRIWCCLFFWKKFSTKNVNFSVHGRIQEKFCSMRKCDCIEIKLTTTIYTRFGFDCQASFYGVDSLKYISTLHHYHNFDCYPKRCQFQSIYNPLQF